MTILQTARLLLRELTPQDADALALVLSDPKTMRYYPAPYDHAGVEQWIARNRRRYRSLCHSWGLFFTGMMSDKEACRDFLLTIRIRPICCRRT